MYTTNRYVQYLFLDGKNSNHLQKYATKAAVLTGEQD